MPWKVKYWGVGNENWGCGGSMKPEYYADLYRRYATYLRNFAENKLYKIACGPYGENYQWTEVLMRKAGESMNALALHYYTTTWEQKGSATKFGEAEWFTILKKALFIDELIEKHSTIMDQYDPDKQVALLVDEWGTWYEVEPGTNPGFLYQQNTLRDALAAGVTLNIFNKHCNRVKMANIAQTINVLQAMILTKDEKMILTPTYHVFEMYKVHHDAKLLPSYLECTGYQFEGEEIPALSASASRDSSGKIHISLCNLDPGNCAELVCELRGSKANKVSGRILTAQVMNAHNTFEYPQTIKTDAFNDVKLKGNFFTATLPAKSVVVLEIE
jgi:alpha-N-arabinofuranosidase